MKTWIKALVAVAMAAVIGGVVLAADKLPVNVVYGDSYWLLYGADGKYLIGAGSANPTLRTGFSTSGNNIPDGSLYFRTDLSGWRTPSSGSWGAASFANMTLTGATLTTATLDTPTITTPNITSPTVTGADAHGILITKVCNITENATNTTYTCTIPIPATAVIEDIQVIGRTLWNGASASMNVGDTADENGYFDTINLKSSDLVIGEMLSVKHSTLWGGQEGAYLVSATGQRGPTTSNFSMAYIAGSNITFVVTEGDATGTAGRTSCIVIYSMPEGISPVLS